MPEISAFCPGCGMGVATAAAATVVASAGVRDRIFGAFAYFTFVPAVVFLRLDRYKRNRFVRFHSWQSIFLTLAAAVIGVSFWLLLSVLAWLPRVGPLLSLLGATLALLAGMILWVVMMVKALQGEAFQLPLLGRLAEKQVTPL